MTAFRVPKNQEISQNAEIGESPGASARERPRVRENVKRERKMHSRVSGVFFRVRSVSHKLLAREPGRFHFGGVGDQQRSSEAQVRRERIMFKHPGGFLFATTPNQI